MKFLLLGGNISNILEQSVISKLLKDNKVNRLLFMGITGKDDRIEKYKRLLRVDPDVRKYSPQLFTFEGYKAESIDFTTYDAIYVPGGDFESASRYLDDRKFRTEILNWFGSPRSKLFIGSSFGAKMLCKQYYNWSNEQLDEAKFMSNGLGILPNVLIDVHFSQYNLQARMRKALAEHPVKLGIGIDEGSYLTGNLQNGNFEVGQIFGGVHFYRQA